MDMEALRKNEAEAAKGPSDSTAGIAATFTIAPQLVELEYGPEPSLYTILCKFYEDRGITPESARRTAVAYSLEWSKLAKTKNA